MNTIPRVGHTEGGHSFAGGDPSDSANWKKIGVAEDGFKFSGGDPAKKDNWEPIIDDENEASLGVMNRAQYAIEPIQSNRKAFLEREFGQENIMEDKNGELYLKQNGSFLPLNKGGVSVADAADFAGALPEMVGGAVGTVAGAVGGAGVASVPGAIALGAAGGAAGSAARQGMSAMLGTPQVASMGERAVETGLSGVFGGVGTGVGLAAKAGINKVKPGISQIIKNLKGGAKEASETVSKSVANTDVALQGELKPIFAEQSAKEISGAVADQSQRGAVQAEKESLEGIAKRQGIPGPTYAQAAQGKALIAEAKIMDTPLIGGKVRKQVDSQLKAIKDNLETITGKFIDVDSDPFSVGEVAKEFADTSKQITKQAAQELYEQVEEEGAEAMIGKTTFFNKFRDQAGKLGLINPDLSKADYAADSSFTRDTFKVLQDVVFDGIDAIQKTGSPKIRFESANALRKTVKASAEEMRDKNPNAARLLTNFGKELDATIEGILNREAPKLGEKFKAANQNWAKFKGQEELYDSFFKSSLNNENVAKSLMSGTNNIKKMQELIGEERVRDIAVSHVRDMLGNLGKSGIGRADTVLTAIRKQKAQIEMALGKNTYDKLVDNLHFLNRTGQPIGVARASLYNILDNRGPGLKGLAVNIAGGAKTLAESKGTTVTKATAGKIFETTSKVVPTTSKGASNAANILGDNPQRSSAYFPSKASSSVTEKEKEIERRKRAISGSK